MKLALVNDVRSRIKGSRTLWDYLEEGLEARFFSLKDWLWRWKLSKFKPDMIIQNAFWGDLNTARIAPVIALVQDYFPYLLKNHLLPDAYCHRKISDIMEMCDNAKKIVIMYPSQREGYHLLSRNVVQIPPAVDGDIFYVDTIVRQTVRDFYRIGEGLRCNIFVGDDSPIHGWAEVSKHIEKTPEEMWFVVSKHRPIKQNYRNVISEFNISHVTLRGLYNASDLFYARGSIGLPAIEAMFCNIPIDVCRTGYFEDWYPENSNPRLEALPRFEVRHVIRAWEELVKEVA